VAGKTSGIQYRTALEHIMKKKSNLLFALKKAGLNNYYKYFLSINVLVSFTNYY